MKLYILLGYPGVGKSTLARDAKATGGMVDLESSWLRTKQGRPGNWEEIYCQIAKGISKQGYLVMAPTHNSIIETLAKKEFNDMTKILVYPSLELEDEWKAKLQIRAYEAPTEANIRASDRVMYHYREDIKALSEIPDSYHIEIQDLNYRLSHLLWKLLEEGI